MMAKVGDTASLKKRIGAEDVRVFAEITGDANPIHLDEEFARTSLFKKPIAHGMLVAGLLSAVIGKQLPGEGSIYLSQTLSFKKPVYIGDEITAIVEVLRVREDKGIYTLSTRCLNQADEIVLDGEAVVMHPKFAKSA